MSFGEFEKLSDLGKGSFGSVYKVKRKNDGKIYALKKVDMSRLNNKEKENSLNEVRILASVNCENVVSYKDAFYDTESNSLCIVMEYADDGDLESKINKNEKLKQIFPEEEIWRIFTGMALGIKSLHDKNIMHRDLKSANIFLNKNGDAKIGDMNVSKVLKMGLLNNTQTGTPYYASPEVWKDQPYDYKSDIDMLVHVSVSVTISIPIIITMTMTMIMTTTMTIHLTMTLTMITTTTLIIIMIHI